MEWIASRKNPRIVNWSKLHEKKERNVQKRFLIEGEHLIQEALKYERVETILTTEETAPFSFADMIRVHPSVMKKLSRNVSPVRYMAVCRMKEETVQKTDRLLLLDDIQDPGNIGTLIRTAVSFSFAGIYLSAGCCDIYNEKVIRSTQGALFAIPLVFGDLHDVIDDLHRQGVCVYAGALDAALPLSSVRPTEKAAILLGNEGQGVHSALQSCSDVCVRIEMHGFESLNVAVAGGIMMYRFRA
ncbi:MAG: TrmH family RNA methyltransferase [Bulleidia sp.]